MQRSQLLYWLVIAFVAVPGGWIAYNYAATPRPPTIEEYISEFGGSAQLMDSTSFDIAGQPASCNGLPIVANARLNDVAAAHPGFLIINTRHFTALPVVIQRYAFFHECGHQTVGRNEVAADCYAVETGLRQGWLDGAGLEAICAYWRPDPGDSEHLPGEQRCQEMRKCFVKAGG